jgi:hypothetical protein
MADTSRKLFQGRSFTSLLLTLAFIWMSFSGLVLYIGPPGGLARRTGWTYAGLGRDDWMVQHFASCAVFLLAGLAHIWFNRRCLWSYFHAKGRRGLNRRWEILAAAALTAFMIVGAMWNVPPWNWLASGSRHLRAYRAEARQGDGHGPHSRPRDGGLGRGEGKGARDGKGFHGGRGE